MTYTLCKTKILAGRYEREDMLEKLDVYLLNDRISTSQYDELVGLMGGDE